MPRPFCLAARNWSDTENTLSVSNDPCPVAIVAGRRANVVPLRVVAGSPKSVQSVSDAGCTGT